MFGSFARGTAGPDSDVDLLVEAEPGTSLFELGELYLDLQDLLGTRVDLVTDGGLNPRLRDRILAEAVLTDARGDTFRIGHMLDACSAQTAEIPKTCGCACLRPGMH